MLLVPPVSIRHFENEKRVSENSDLASIIIWGTNSFLLIAGGSVVSLKSSAYGLSVGSFAVLLLVVVDALSFTCWSLLLLGTKCTAFAHIS